MAAKYWAACTRCGTFFDMAAGDSDSCGCVCKSFSLRIIGNGRPAGPTIVSRSATAIMRARGRLAPVCRRNEPAGCRF